MYAPRRSGAETMMFLVCSSRRMTSSTVVFCTEEAPDATVRGV